MCEVKLCPSVENLQVVILVETLFRVATKSALYFFVALHVFSVKLF